MNLPPESLAVELLNQDYNDDDRLEAFMREKEEQPNAETIAALEEFYEMEHNPTAYKRYSSFSELLAEIENEA